MSKEPKSALRRVMDAIVEGRARQAERYVEQFLRDHPHLRGDKN